MVEHPVSRVNARQYLDTKTITLTDRHWASLSPATVNHEHCPTITITKHAARRQLQNIVFVPENKPGFNAITIAQALPLIHIRSDGDDHPDPLFLNTQRRDFGKADRLDSSDDSLEWSVTTPTLEQNPHACLDFDSIHRQDINHNLQGCGIGR